MKHFTVNNFMTFTIVKADIVCTLPIIIVECTIIKSYPKDSFPKVPYPKVSLPMGAFLMEVSLIRTFLEVSLPMQESD